VTKTAADVLSLIADEGYEFVDLRFCDLPGQVQHFTVPVKQLTEDSFDDGFGFDGSSIRGFQQIQESDMLLIPDPSTAVDDPFRERKTLILYCFVNDPLTGAPYDRDPRYVAKKAEEYLLSTGIADTSYWGPEAEFYIFDDVRFGQNQFSGFYYVDSVEGAWNSGAREEGGNLGYKPRYKEGYFPVPPTDHFQDLRSEMTANLEAAGIEIEVQHHEVGTAGQAEIDMRYDTLLRTADNVTLYKYIVKNTAWAYGRSVTFMPKPIFEDNGSGMHTHQSLWRDGTPLFFDESGYAGLSDTLVDLRVDDHADPLGELRRLYRLHDDLFGRTPREEWIEVDDTLRAELEELLGRLGRDSLASWAGVVNLEERVDGEDEIE